MDKHIARARRAYLGVAAMTLGGVAVVAGVATPASGHESKVEPKPVEDNLSCLELADLFEVDQEWTEFKIGDVANEDFTNTYPIGADDSVTITVHQGKTFDFEATLGIDAVYVQGEDTALPLNSYFYLYAPEEDSPEVTEDEDLGTPPWHKWDKNKIRSISFCYDEEDHGEPTTSSSSSTSTSSSSTSTTSSTTTSTVAPSSTTSTSVVPAPAGPTSTRPAPPATTSRDRLPDTGSNTGPLVTLGLVLVVVGAVLVASTRRFWHRTT